MVSSEEFYKWGEELQESILKGESNRMRQLLEKFNVPSILRYEYPTLLHHPTVIQNLEAVAFAIETGCDVNAKNMAGRTPLSNAVFYDNFEAVKLLIKHGANYGDCYFDKKNGLLHMAAKNGNPDMIQKLLKNYEFDVKARNSDGRTPLFIVIDFFLNDSCYEDKKKERLEAMQILINAGSNVNDVDGKQVPLLCYAVRTSIEAVKLLLGSGAQINIVDASNQSALFYAIYYANTDMAKLLMESGIDINSTNVDGCTCLHKAAKNYDSKMVKLLLDHGASITIINNRDLDPFCYSINYWSDIMMCDDDLIEEFSIESYDKIIDNLFKKIPRIMTECMKLLLKAGAKINQKIGDHTPLNLLIERKSHYYLVKCLLENGATYDYERLEEICKEFDDFSKKFSTKKISKIPYVLIQHAVMAHVRDQSIQLPFCPENFCNEFYEYSVQCENELRCMRENVFYGCVSFLNILIDKNIGPYARNEKIVDEFAKKLISTEFPIYGCLLIERFDKEYKKQKLLLEAANCLSPLLGWEVSSYPLIYDNILKYFNDEELQMLVLIKEKSLD